MNSEVAQTVILSGVGWNPIEVLLVEISHLIRAVTIVFSYSLFTVHQRSDIQVVIAAGSHLFPFRTEKLSPLAPMVLRYNAGEQVTAPLSSILHG